LSGADSIGDNSGDARNYNRLKQSQSPVHNVLLNSLTIAA
jgi:hypothetical protein